MTEAITLVADIDVGIGRKPGLHLCSVLLSILGSHDIQRCAFHGDVGSVKFRLGTDSGSLATSMAVRFGRHLAGTDLWLANQCQPESAALASVSAPTRGLKPENSNRTEEPKKRILHNDVRLNDALRGQGITGIQPISDRTKRDLRSNKRI